MLPTRCNLSSSQIGELREYLDRRIGALGLESQPVVVARILDLNSSQTASFSDYAKVIRTDPALSGRLLKIANSAYYAQRKPVTGLDRACVLIGLERLKAFSLGFYLGRGAADRESEFSRSVWGQSVFRACLAAELTREAWPILVVEAFVIGLVLDAGLGLMPRLMHGDYAPVIDANLPPDELFDREFKQQEFTHVDVVSALLRKWRLPDLLARPIELHHAPPARRAELDPIAKLHRIAFVVGQADCRRTLSPEETSPTLPAKTEELLGIGREKIVAAIQRAVVEYQAAIDLFAEFASKLCSLEELSSRVQVQLADTLDDMLELGGGACAEVIERFLNGDTLLEARRQSPGSWIAYLCDGSGGHLAQVTFQIAHADVRAIRESLGLSGEEDTLIRSMVEMLAKRAA